METLNLYKLYEQKMKKLEIKLEDYTLIVDEKYKVQEISKISYN